MTTFQSREAVRDELVTLFTSNGAWQAVYGYFPTAADVVGNSPILTIRSRGTSVEMAGAVTNPVTYRFLLSSWVYVGDDDNSWSANDAEDKLDELDKVLRQVIRDNAGGGTNADFYRFEDGFSQVSDVVMEGVPYIVESRAILAELVNGAV